MYGAVPPSAIPFNVRAVPAVCGDDFSAPKLSSNSSGTIVPPDFPILANEVVI